MAEVWIIKSKHIDPNGFYVNLDDSDFYIAYWIANTSSDQQATLLTLEACVELDLGQVEIQEVIEYSGQQISSMPEVDAAIKAAKEKYKAFDDVQLVAWVTSLGGKW